MGKALASLLVCLNIRPQFEIMELLIGCGHDKGKKVFVPGKEAWSKLVTLDHNPVVKPDVLHDLEKLPYPFKDNQFDEVHAYDVLEHIGTQGDYKTFFSQFSEFWRILKPGGQLCAICPAFDSPWAFGDPGHKRVINAQTLVFLSQKQYESQQGKYPMTDYRNIYKADFEVTFMETVNKKFVFVLKAIKGSPLEIV